MDLVEMLLRDMSHRAAIREILWRLDEEEAKRVLYELLSEYERRDNQDAGQ